MSKNNIRGKLPPQVEERLKAFCSEFDGMDIEVGRGLLVARAMLIADGDAPAAWTERPPFSSEITVLFYMLTEPFDPVKSAQALIDAMAETGCDEEFKDLYPEVYDMLTAIAADDRERADSIRDSIVHRRRFENHPFGLAAKKRSDLSVEQARKKEDGLCKSN